MVEIKDKYDHFQQEFNRIEAQYAQNKTGFSDLAIATKEKRPHGTSELLVSCNALWYEYLDLQMKIKKYLYEKSFEDFNDSDSKIHKENIQSILEDVTIRISQLSSHSSSLSNQTAIVNGKFAYRIAVISIILSVFLFVISTIYSIFVYFESTKSSEEFYKKESNYQEKISNELMEANTKIRELEKMLEEHSKTVNKGMDPIQPKKK